MKKFLFCIALSTTVLASPNTASAQLLSTNQPTKTTEFVNSHSFIAESFWKNLFKHPNIEQLKNVTSSNITFRSATGSGFHGQHELSDYIKSLESIISSSDIHIKNVSTHNDKTIVKAIISGVLQSGKPFSYDMTASMTIRNEKIEEIVEVGDVVGLAQFVSNIATLDFDKRVNKLNAELDNLMPDGVWKN